VYGGASDDETTTTTADAKRLRTQLNVGMVAASTMLCVAGHCGTPQSCTLNIRIRLMNSTSLFAMSLNFDKRVHFTSTPRGLEHLETVSKLESLVAGERGEDVHIAFSLTYSDANITTNRDTDCVAHIEER
jgi:hypothetical protein